MKKLFLAVFMIMAAAPAWAQGNGLEPRKVSQFKAGIDTSYISYTESSLDVEEKGFMVSLYGDYDYHPDASIVDVFHFDGRIGAGLVDYKGSGTIDNVMDYIFEPRAWIGKDFNICPAARVTPYVGVGYRMLFDDLSDKTSSTGAAGYLRRSQYVYAPVGFQLATELSGWQVGLNAEYDIFIQGWQTSYLSDISGFPDITNKQKKGYGLRGSIDILKKGERYDLTFSPYARFWHIDQSESTTATGSLFQITGYEPENKSLEVGLKVGIGF